MRTNRNGLVQTAGPVLVPDGDYPARLADVFRFENAHGERMGFSYEIDGGLYAGAVLMQSAAVSESPTGRLACVLRELLGREPSRDELREGLGREYIGLACRILTREDRNRAGMKYSAVYQVRRT